MHGQQNIKIHNRL